LLITDDKHRHLSTGAASTDHNQQTQAVGFFKRHRCLSRPQRVTSSRDNVTACDGVTYSVSK
jgi:hypothetical protein